MLNKHNQLNFAMNHKCGSHDKTCKPFTMVAVWRDTLDKTPQKRVFNACSSSSFVNVPSLITGSLELHLGLSCPSLRLPSGADGLPCSRAAVGEVSAPGPASDRTRRTGRVRVAIATNGARGSRTLLVAPKAPKLSYSLKPDLQTPEECPRRTGR